MIGHVARLRCAGNRVQLEEPWTCVQSASGILVAYPLECDRTREGRAMARIIGALITAIFVALALLGWITMRM